MARDYFADVLAGLTKNIENRLIPVLKTGDDEALSHTEGILKFFIQAPIFSLEAIQTLNGQMSSMLPTSEAEKAGRLVRLTAFFSVHKVARHAVVASTLFILSSALYYSAVTYLGIAKEYAFAGSLGIFGVLLTIYFTRQPKE